MTDITKYKNVTLTKETYSHIQTLSKEVFDIPISLSKTIQYLAEKEIERKKKNSHGKSKYFFTERLNVTISFFS